MPRNNAISGLSQERAREIIRELAGDSGRVYFTHHAETRMRERHIARTQVLSCLEKGRFHEGPYQNTRGEWECQMRWFTAGDNIGVVLTLNLDVEPNYILIITTLRAT